MLISEASHKETERLLHVLLCGEHLAASISKLQSQYFKDTHRKFSHFFNTQSRQESFHASIFKSALLWLNPKSTFSEKTHSIFTHIEQDLTTALNLGNIHDTILGLQIIVEALGECALRDLDIRLEKYRIGLSKIRRRILNQEQAHHRFGEHYFEGVSLDYQQQLMLPRTAEHYLEQIGRLLDDIEPSLDHFQISTNAYLASISCDIDKVVNGRRNGPID